MYNIEKVWQIEQDILDLFDKICREHNLKYSLAYGTLLGSIRHKGFIPWDDDIDVMMPRDDYEKFVEIWKRMNITEYVYQDYDIILDYPNNFAKICRNNTTFLQNDRARTRTFHKGIFIDIFPMDKVPQNKILKKIQYVFCAINLLYSRGFKSKSNKMLNFFEGILLSTSFKNYRRIRLLCEKIIKCWNKQVENKYFCNCTLESCKQYFEKDLFSTLIEAEFNGKKYLIIKEYDSYLKKVYGDYMALPPEEQRVLHHHPIIIDYERNYEDL